MAFKKSRVHAPAPESPDRLFHDLSRRKHASLYDHQGQVLRTYVSKALDAPDVALQLPTGSGKTLVGLLLAEWRRRKFRERVVYLCPTRQLVYQVCEEASGKYGLTAEPFVGSAAQYGPNAKAAYFDSERIAVTTYSSLFNVNPFFREPDIIILDDAHAAENYIASQWTLRINRSDPRDQALFMAVVSVLRGILPDSSLIRLTGEWQRADDIGWVDKVPTSVLDDIADELHAVISANIAETDQRFPWSLMSDHVRACQLYISSSEIILRPLIPPTWSHSAFAGAKQRIFMSATLGAGGDLERLTGRPNIVRLPIPEGWDRQGIGRRFFIFPERSLDDSEVIELRHDLMRIAGRSLVLTPSLDRAAQVARDVDVVLSYPVFNAYDLESDKEKFTATSPAVAVVANRYDGIDFPNNDCRLLFVEGLPRTVNLQERFLMNRMGANQLFNERIQTRVLQAIGRCTRGLNDYSAVVIIGDDLAGYLTDIRRREYFHPELQAELDFGITQSTEVESAEIVENLRVFLEHDEEWERANQSILEVREEASQASFPAMDDLASVVSKELDWQAAMWNEDYEVAFEAAREVLGGLTHSDLRGYRALWHYLAGSSAEYVAKRGGDGFEAHARAHFRSAKKAAAGIPWLIPLASATENSLDEEPDKEALMLQVERLEGYLLSLGTVHNRHFSSRERDIREGLLEGSSFEQAQVLLGEHLGFKAGKRETDASPDPWWIIGSIAIVFEDHANADGVRAVIDASKARQAATHPDWLRENVPESKDCTIYPVLVTPATSATEGAMPHLSRVSYWGLADFRQWAERVLATIRELRRSFVEPGNLVWRAEASSALVEIGADANGLAAWLAGRPAQKHLIQQAPRR